MLNDSLSFPFFPVLWTFLVPFLAFRCRPFLPLLWLPVGLSGSCLLFYCPIRSIGPRLLGFLLVTDLSLPQLRAFVGAGSCVFRVFLCRFYRPSDGFRGSSLQSQPSLPVLSSTSSRVLRVLCSRCYTPCLLWLGSRSLSTLSFPLRLYAAGFRLFDHMLVSSGVSSLSVLQW